MALDGSTHPGSTVRVGLLGCGNVGSALVQLLGRQADAIFARAGRIPGLHLNCNAYRGVAMNDCARESRELALRIATRQ